MKNNVAKASLILMIATMIAKVLGLLRELILASTYGANIYSDAYLVALNIPTVIFASISIAISTVFIPVYVDVEKECGKRAALKFTNNLINIMILCSLIISVLGIIFTEQIVKILAIGFNGETLQITINFTKILMIGIGFIILTYLANSYLQINNNFIIPGLVSIPYNILIIVSIIISIKYSPYIMVWGTLLGIIVQLTIQIPSIYKRGYKYRFEINLKDPNLKKILILLVPVFLGVAVNQINTMIDRTLASTLVEGSISALNYANKLNLFVMALFITSISTAIYPWLAKISNKDKKDEFIDCIVKSINSVVILVIPICIGAIVLSHPIVKLLFQRGEFDERAANMTSIALVMYSIGMVSFGLREILGKIFYSLKDTKTPMINGIITVCINIILNIVLIKYLKLAGLALATSISSIICTILLFKSLNEKIGYFRQEKILKTALKSIFAAIVMGIFTYLAHRLLINLLGSIFIMELISLLGAILVGVVVYGILVIVLKIDEINSIIDIIKRKIKLKI